MMPSVLIVSSGAAVGSVLVFVSRACVAPQDGSTCTAELSET
jgi:hypothetical protein